MVDKRSLAAVPLRGVPSERAGLGTQRCSEARTQGTKDLRDLHPRPPWKCSRWTAPSPTSDPLPARPDECPSGRGSSRRGKATGAPFPRPPSRPRARRAPPNAPRLGPPAWRGGARPLGGEQGRRPRGRSRRTAPRRTAAGRGGGRAEATPIGAPIPAASRRPPRAPAEPPPAPSPEPGRTGEGRSGRSARAPGAAGGRHQARPAQRP